MQRKNLKLDLGFHVAINHRGSRAAEMVIAPGGIEGDETNRHRGSDQWLYVISGAGSAIVSSRRRVLGAGTLLLIERGETHEVRNTGTTPLRTLNIYVPPAYREDGDPLPAGRS
jgi:mannose-6-phosphate isomerase-like protein (cupin superfamily)